MFLGYIGSRQGVVFFLGIEQVQIDETITR